MAEAIHVLQAGKVVNEHRLPSTSRCKEQSMTNATAEPLFRNPGELEPRNVGSGRRCSPSRSRVLLLAGQVLPGFG